MAAVLALAVAGCFGGDYGAPVFGSGQKPRHGHATVHVVRQGDTLYSIAWDAGLDYRAVARWNGISAPYVIRPGEKLRLRPRHAERSETRARGSSHPPVENEPQGARLSANPTWIWPTRGPIIRRFSRTSASPGIDIAGHRGQIIRSAADGRVVYTGDGLRGYGELIIVKHNDVFLSAYAHNRKVLVHEGESVRRGQPIAQMGSTGTNQVMLHFEIRKEGTAVDPLHYLPKN